MTTIQLISSTTIQATNHDDNSTHNHKIIDLTPWDVKFLKFAYIQQGLLFHKPKTNQIQHLKQTLSSTLNFFPPLAGRLVITPHDEHNNVSCSIICNNIGALFVHAALENTRIANILQPTFVPPIVLSFFPHNEVKNYEGTSHPLLAVQVTELLDGIFIGFAINHAVADDKSFWHFVNSWAEISRGFDKPSNIPLLERFFPNNINRPIVFPFIKETETQNQPCEYFPSHRIFHFSKNQLLQLKSKANAKIDNSEIVISSLQTLLSHLWRLTISKLPHLKPENVTIFTIPVDCRTRTCPKLGDNYFGSGIGVGVVLKMQVGELMESSISEVGMKINKMISLQSHEKIMSVYESWVNTPHVRETRGGKLPRLVVANSPRFDVYGNDFGWGKPIAVRSGFEVNNSKIGKFTLFGGVEEDGSIDVEVCLPRDVLEALGNDRFFMDDVSA